MNGQSRPSPSPSGKPQSPRARGRHNRKASGEEVVRTGLRHAQPPADSGAVIAVTGPAWQRPPFPPGNVLSLKHGANSARVTDPLAADLAQSVAGVDYLNAEPAFAAAVSAWARAEARVLVVSEYLDANGVLDAKGKPRPAADLLVKLERLASEARARLGLDPMSRARLGKDLSGAQVDLARLWQAESEAAEKAGEP